MKFLNTIQTVLKLKSTAPQGTAPLEVDSTTVVTNLNVDMVDGCHAGTSANNVLKLDASGKVPIGNIPTGTTSTTVALGDHTHTGYTKTVTSATQPTGMVSGDTWLKVL